MGRNNRSHRNIGLDEFLVAVGEQAPTILQTLPSVLLTDKRFRATARYEQRLRERTDPDIVEAFAHQQLETLVQHAQTDAQQAIQAVLDNPETLEALAFLAERDRGAMESAFIQLRNAKAREREIKALERVLTACRRQRRMQLVAPGYVPTRSTVRGILPDAPVSEDIVVPPGWRLNAEGVGADTSDHSLGAAEVSRIPLMAPSPILICGRLKDIADDVESLRLVWHRDGRWNSHTVPRIQIASAREIVSLAGVGFPVTSHTAPHMVRYLADFESVNLDNLPKARVSKHMGFQGDRGEHGFLWGNTLIRANGEQAAAVAIDEVAPMDWQEDFVAFHGADAGDAQWAKAFHAAGSFEGWSQMAKSLAAYPRGILAVYASLAPVVLPVIDAPNFCIDYCGFTSTGKTTVLRVAASAWGCPDESAPAAALGTWDSTRVWIERSAAVLNNLPLILDDTKRARPPRNVAQVLYDLTSGRGRGRGSLRGMRSSGSWRTVGIFSGEAPAVSFTEDGGTRGRVLTLWGLPFDAADEKTAAVVHEINTGILANYGHAGPQFAGYVLHNRDQWDEWKRTYQMVRSEYLKKAGANAVAGRLAAYFAALEFTATLAHDALKLPWEYRDPIDTVWEVLTREASEADRAAHALAHVVSWAMGHQREFWGRHDTDREGDPRLPVAGIAGVWPKGDDWKTLAFLPNRLTDILKQAGFESDAILRLWRDREWLDVGEDRNRHQKKVSIDGEKSWAYVIKREAIESLNERQTEGAQA